MPDTDAGIDSGLNLREQLGHKLLVIDDFFEDFESIRSQCWDRDYDGVVNGADAVEYPYVNLDVPGREEIETAFGKPLELFLRLSPAGCVAPHPVHSDTLQSDVTMIIYINDPVEDMECGTGMMTHRATGLNTTPITPEEFDLWERDYKDLGAWRVEHMIQMRANRAVLFPSVMMHMALPHMGFGEGIKDSRLIIGGFFK